MITAELRIKTKSPGKICKALKPDMEKTDRSQVRITAKKSELHIRINAKDITAMRAMLNSYLRLINTVEGVEEIN